MRLADSLARQRDQLSAEGMRQSLLGAKKVYSDKYIKKLTDSLGGEKAAKLLKTATAMTKTEASESDMLDKINQSMGGKEWYGLRLEEPLTYQSGCGEARWLSRCCCR